MGPDTRMRPATFGEFGVAAVAEVLTPRFLQKQLNAALSSMLRGPDWLADLPGDVTSVRAATPTLVEEDGYERRFEVTVHGRMAAEVGPRTLAFGIDANVELDLTVRVGAFRPAIIRIDVDPVTPDSFRVRTEAHSDWLPRTVLADGGSRLTGVAERSMPVLAAAVNRALTASVPRRQLDVLAQVRRYHQVPDDPRAPRAGTLGPAEALEWLIELEERERVTVRLWAGIDTGIDTDRDPGSAVATGRSLPSAMELEVRDPDGIPVDALTLAVRRSAPDFDTGPTGVVATADHPGVHQARLCNRGVRPLRYRLEEHRTVVPGERIGFAELGTLLIERGVDRHTIARAVTSQLARHAQRMVDAPAFVRGIATTRLVEVTAQPAESDQLRFGLTLDIEVELQVGPGANATVLASTLRAEVRMRISAMVKPAGLRVDFEPVPPESLRIVDRPHRVRGRYAPVPQRRLAELLLRHVGPELNRRLDRANRRIIAAEMVAGPPEGLSERPLALRAEAAFAGTAAPGEPGRHPVRVADGQRILAEARVVNGQGGGSRTDLAAELAVCDEHGGVWAADHVPLPANGDPVILGVEFTAPHAGQWRLRVESTGGPGELQYELRARPRPEDTPE